MSFRTAFAEAVVAEVKMMSHPAPSKYASNFRMLEYEELRKAAVNASTGLQGEIRKMLEDNEEYLEETLESMQETHATINNLRLTIHDYQRDMNDRVTHLEKRVSKNNTANLLAFSFLLLIYAFIFWGFKRIYFPDTILYLN